MINLDLGNVVKALLPVGLGALLMFLLMQTCNSNKENVTISSDSTLTIVSDTIINIDSIIASVNNPTIIDTLHDTNYVDRWLKPESIHDTIKDSILVRIPVLVYSDTIRTNSNNTLWYKAIVEGELRKIDLGAIISDTIIRDTVKIVINNIEDKTDLYIGARLRYDFIGSNIDQVSIPLDLNLKNSKWSFNVSPGYNIANQGFTLGGGASYKLGK